MKSKAYVIATIFTMCFAVGCSQKAGVEEKHEVTQIKIDKSTPDKAIKSYWAARDKVREERRNWYVSNLNTLQNMESTYSELVNGDVREGWKAGEEIAETFIRDIIEVKVESESRAVILVAIKNTTPVPAGAEMDKHDTEKRRDGDRYRYIMEKDSTGWRVAEIWEFRSYLSNGDFTKIVPADRKPIVRAWTYNGF